LRDANTMTFMNEAPSEMESPEPAG
jgi:hypothetical protein